MPNELYSFIMWNYSWIVMTVLCIGVVVFWMYNASEASDWGHLKNQVCGWVGLALTIFFVAAFIWGGNYHSKEYIRLSKAMYNAQHEVAAYNAKDIRDFHDNQNYLVKQRLRQIKPTNEISGSMSGSFVLGTGSVSGSISEVTLFSVYAVDDNDAIRLLKIPVEKAKIYEDATITTAVVSICGDRYTLHVPPGSVTVGIDLNLR